MAASSTLFCNKHQTCQGSPLSGSEPRLNTEVYNNPAVVESHNCYWFATSPNDYDPNQLGQCTGNPKCAPRFHQPGGTKGEAKVLRNSAGRRCKVVERLVNMDIPDLKPSSFKARCPVGSSKIAMVTHPGEDYHFYVEGPDGMWLHKDGANSVKNYDAEGRPIFNPEFASRDYRPKSFLNYKDFCGFYCIPRGRRISLKRDET